MLGLDSVAHVFYKSLGYEKKEGILLWNMLEQFVKKNVRTNEAERLINGKRLGLGDL